MSNGLARASVRFRPSAFVGSFVALLFAVVVMTACGTLLQTGLTAHLAPVRYAHTPVVVAADQSVRIEVQHGKEPEQVAEALPDRARLDTALATRIAAEPGVAAALPDLAFPVEPAQGSNLPPLTGRDFSAAAITVPGAPGGPAGDVLAQGSAPQAGQVVLDAATARAAHLAPGDTVELTGPAGAGAFRVSGIAQQQAADGTAAGTGSGTGTAWFADAEAGRLSGHPGQADAIAVLPRAGVSTEALAAQVRQAVGSSAEVSTGDARGAVEQPQLAGGKEALTGLGGSFGGIAAMTAVFVVMGTLSLAVGQRAREFAMLRAIGATPRQIRRTIATEAMLVAPLAGALGVLPGLGLAHWWLGQLVQRGAVPAGVSLDVGWLPIVGSIAVGLLSALGAGYAAARRPAKARPSQALGDAATARVRTGPVRTVLGVLALAGTVVLGVLSSTMSGTSAANTALGVVMAGMTGVALLGPLVARASASVLGLPLRGRAAGAPGALAAANSRANARRLASALVPIVMVTAFCSILLFLQSTITHVSSQQVRTGVVADQVIGSTGAGLPADTAARAASTPGVAAAVGVLRSGALYESAGALGSATVLGVSGDPAQLPHVLDLDVRTGSLDRVGSGTVALDATLADTLGLKVGDRAPLWLGDGTKVDPLVVATYGNGLGLGQVLMGRAELVGHVSSGFDSQVLVADAPGGDSAAVGHALAGLGIPGATVTDRAGYAGQADKDLALSSWANTVMAAVLGGFAAVATANTLVMTVLDRRREVAMLRLAGTTRRQVRRMIRWEALLVSSAGLLIGGVLAAIGLIPIAQGVTGSAPYVPPATAAALVGGTLALGLAATALPARSLLRSRPVEAGSGRG